MIAVAVRPPQPRPPGSGERPRLLRPIPGQPPLPTSPPLGLRQRFANDRDLVGLKIRLLVALGLLSAALELVS